MSNVSRSAFVVARDKQSFLYFALQFKRSIQSGSVKTKALVHYILRDYLLPEFGSKNVTDITVFDLKQYVSKVKKTVRVYNHVKYFKAIVKLARAKRVTIDSFELFRGPSEVSEKLKVYTPQEIGKLMWACRSRRLWKCRLFIFIAITTALRKSEILGLRWEWFYQTLRPVKINGTSEIRWVHEGEFRLPANYFKKTKYNIPRIIPLNETLTRILVARRRRYPKDVHIFPCRGNAQGKKRDSSGLTDIDRTWGRLVQATGIQGTPHSLRATAATWIALALKDELLTLSMVRMTREVFLRHYFSLPKPQARYAANYAMKLARIDAKRYIMMTRDPVTGLLKDSA